MPRIFRILPEEGALHILTRGNNRRSVFEDDNDYKAYLSCLKKYKKENNISIYHYCLMPNHIHLIIELNFASSLAKFMKQVNLAYLYRYKKKYDYCGHLWQGRYKSLIISNDGYLITCGRYIERNPVKARLVKYAKEYKWSSFNAYAYGVRRGIVDYNPIYLGLGEIEKDRQAFYQESIKGGVEKINFNARFFGPNEFIRKMEEKYKVDNVREKRGRPNKEKGDASIYENENK
ncbi:MAG: transposase [Candidatus Omnitrophota bacterium]